MQLSSRRLARARSIIFSQNARVLRRSSSWDRRIGRVIRIAGQAPANSIRVAVRTLTWWRRPYTVRNTRANRPTDNYRISAGDHPSPRRERQAGRVAAILIQVAIVIERTVLVHPSSRIRRVALAVALSGGHVRTVTRASIWPDIPRSPRTTWRCCHCRHRN